MANDVEMVDLLQLVVDEGVSDLHLEVGIAPVVRLHGEMTPLDSPPLEPEDTVRLVRSIATDSQFAEIEKNGGADFGFAFGDQARFRVSAFKQKGVLGMVLRQIPTTLLTTQRCLLTARISKRTPIRKRRFRRRFPWHPRDTQRSSWTRSMQIEKNTVKSLSRMRITTMNRPNPRSQTRTPQRKKWHVARRRKRLRRA